MSPQQILQLYEGVSRLMSEMVAAAHAHDWERLRDLENQCRPLTHTLMAQESGVELPEELKRSKFFLLRKILEDDAAIRAVTQSWMTELQVLIGRTSAQHKLNKAYGPGLH
jgi:flagellar protein FliT